MDAAGQPGPDPSDELPPLVDIETPGAAGETGQTGQTGETGETDAAADPLSDNTRTCFICLQTPDEAPDAAWVAPCPCTLTAHQECMLLWIDDKERANADDVEVVGDDEQDDNDEPDAGQRRPARRQRRRRREAGQQQQHQQPERDDQGRRLRRTRKVRCPACNAPIYTLEAPPDAWVRAADTLARSYRQYIAPHVLATMAASMAIAGSSYYGFSVFLSVAGPDKVVPWLAGGHLHELYELRPYDLFQPGGSGRARRSGVGAGISTSTLLHQSADLLVTNARMALLGLIAPSLLLHRAMPFFTYSMGLPVSWVWGLSLAVRRYRQTRSLAVAWPPSATFCMAALPSVSMAYAMAYQRVFGRFERRLDQALGHALEAYVEQGNNDNNNVNNNVNNNDDNNNNDAAGGEDPGVLGLMWRLGGAVANRVRGNDGNNAGGNGDGGMFRMFNDNEQIEFQIEVVVEERVDGELQDELQGDDAAWDDVLADAADDAADAPPNIELRPPPRQPAAAPAPPPLPAHADDNQLQLMPERFSVRSIIAASATQLLLPSIASAMGDLLWFSLPSSVTAPGRGRFLGQRWARSLAGGALFVVLRDLFRLYGKYRRVQTRGQRLVKNYDRTKHRDEQRLARAQREAQRERDRLQRRELQTMQDAQLAANLGGLLVDEEEF